MKKSGIGHIFFLVACRKFMVAQSCLDCCEFCFRFAEYRNFGGIEVFAKIVCVKNLETNEMFDNRKRR